MGTDTKNAIKTSTGTGGTTVAMAYAQQISITVAPDGPVRIQRWDVDTCNVDQITVDLATLESLIAAAKEAK